MVRQALRLLSFGLLLVLAMGRGFAQPLAPLPANNIAVDLLLEAEPAPGGHTTLAIRFKPQPGWHGYWLNPGDAGRPSEFKFALPPGVTAGTPAYPVPQTLVIAGLMNHVFEGEHVLLVPILVANTVKPGSELPISVAGDWLACTDQVCKPEMGTMQTVLRVGAGVVDPAKRALFDGWRRKLPFEISMGGRFQTVGDRVRIAVPLPASVMLPKPWLFARTEKAVGYLGPQKISRNGDMVVVELPKSTSGKAVEAFDGVLAAGDGGGFIFHATPGVVAASAGIGTALIAFGGALLGGLLLNILPCVFPVISLKALGLVRSGASEAAARREALAYTLGVVLTCLALGGALLGLRAAGVAVGWAFQLQNPWTIALLLILCLAITANLLGLFELPVFGGGSGLAGQGGARGAFFTGALAAFVATPCTGPFMAAALGAALVLPVGAALAIFGGLGLGMALPFLAIGFVPALRTRLPKPGAWMETFRKALAIPMAITALALGWLLVQQLQGSNPMAREQSLRAQGRVPFDLTRLAALRDQGKPIFLYFTADWCLTCKVNEKVAIETTAALDHFRAEGIETMVGDWTNGDPVITRFLETQGRSGVPLYLFYPKGGGDPRQLPEVLTPGLLAGL